MSTKVESKRVEATKSVEFAKGLMGLMLTGGAARFGYLLK